MGSITSTAEKEKKEGGEGGKREGGREGKEKRRGGKK